MSKALIMKLIIYYSSFYGIDSSVALAVAEHESGFNPNTIGAVGEIGIYQVRPEFSELTKKELKDPVNNIKEGLRLLKIAKDTCTHKKKNDWLVCFNVGKTGALKIKHPDLFPYVKSVNALIASNK